jgi:hypothetical protein
MADNPKFVDDVPVGRIFLALENPRHKSFETEEQVIARLCAKEDVYPLARDIVKHGLNPLERFALVPLESKRSGGVVNYSAAEGNRRVCALKLLLDPERAPAKLRKAFQKLSEQWASPIKAVDAAVFDDMDSVNLWLDRIHNGPQGGIGRKGWNAEQKQRFDGGSKNRAAQALLDYAEAQKMITSDERAGKLTTVQRFLGNDVFREAIGFDQSNSEDTGRTRPKAEFDILAKRFMKDLIGKKNVNSRMNKPEIVTYARTLASLPGITTTRVESEALSSSGAVQSGRRAQRKKKPGKPQKAQHVRYEDEIFVALKGLGNEKLLSLYYSICEVDLDPHTPLVAIGTWAFFETLTACAGRNDSTSFEDFLSNQKLRAYDITGQLTALRQAMQRIAGYGNTTKHHPIAVTFNGDQLNNDIVALKGVILKCIAEAVSKGG